MTGALRPRQHAMQGFSSSPPHVQQTRPSQQDEISQSRAQRLISQAMPITQEPLDIFAEGRPAVCRGHAGIPRRGDQIKRDEIAVNTRHLLPEHMPKGTKLRLADVLKLFELMR